MLWTEGVNWNQISLALLGNVSLLIIHLTTVCLRESIAIHSINGNNPIITVSAFWVRLIGFHIISSDWLFWPLAEQQFEKMRYRYSSFLHSIVSLWQEVFSIWRFVRILYFLFWKTGLLQSLCFGRYSSDLTDSAASSSLLRLCTEDVFHYGCYLWTHNLDIYLLGLPSFLLSSPLIPLISALLVSLLPHSTDMCLCSRSILLLGTWQWKRWLFLVFFLFFFFFALSLFLLSLETTKKNVTFISLCTRHAIHSVPSTKCGSVFEAVLIWGETETGLDAVIFLIHCFYILYPLLSFSTTYKRRILYLYSKAKCYPAV